MTEVHKVKVDKVEVVAVPPTEERQAQQQTHFEGEETLLTLGQRRINLIWEITQAIIALVVTAKLVAGESSDVLTNAFFLIIGFYFSRTNHQKTGGIGGERAGTR